jgi:hypothetical protein
VCDSREDGIGLLSSTMKLQTRVKTVAVSLACALGLLAAGCEDDSSSPAPGASSGSAGASPGEAGSATDSGTSSGESSGDCTFITEADLQAVAGITTTRIPRDPFKGAGSTCNGNFAFGNEMVLLIERLASRAQFDDPGGSMAYPHQEAPADLGAEARLLSSDEADGARALYLWKGERGVQLVSFFDSPGDPKTSLTRDQLLQLGTLAAGRL